LQAPIIGRSRPACPAACRPASCAPTAERRIDASALVDVSGEVTEDLEAKVKMYLARQ
jgi:hypothetical protein